jgi:hypothetical protein
MVFASAGMRLFMLSHELLYLVFISGFFKIHIFIDYGQRS